MCGAQGMPGSLSYTQSYKRRSQQDAKYACIKIRTKAERIACPSVQAGKLWLFKETDENKKVTYRLWQAHNHPELCYQLDFMWQKIKRS